MHKELFDDAIGEVPPSTIDVDAVITRGRRAARIRRVANPAVVAGVAVALLTGAVAYTMTRDDASSRVGAQPSAGTTRATSDDTVQHPPSLVGPPAGCSRPNLETPAQMIARLNPVLDEAFKAQRPDVTLEGRGPYEALKFSLADGDSVCQRGGNLMALAGTRGPEGSGNFQINVFASFEDPGAVNCDGLEGCEVVISARGDVIRKTTGDLKYGGVGSHVEIDRVDGTAVMVSVDNMGTGEYRASATNPPLTVDQMVAIGTDPALTLFPQ